MAKGFRFKRAINKMLWIYFFSAGLLLLPDAVASDDKAEKEVVKIVTETFLRKSDSLAKVLRKQNREKIDNREAEKFSSEYFNNPSNSRLFLNSHLLSFSIKDVDKIIDETKDFRLINKQNEIFKNYIRLEKDSRYYSILLSNLAALQKRLPDKIKHQNSIRNMPVSFQNSCFVHKDSLEKYRNIELQLHTLYKKIFETAFLKNRTQETVNTVFSSLNNSYQIVEFLHYYEVDEKVLEQQSRVSLAYRLYNFYKQNNKRMNALLGNDYRELQGSGLWNFKVYELKCDVAVNTCPQCRGIRFEEQQWILHVVNFNSDNLKSGWQVWGVNKILSKK